MEQMFMLVRHGNRDVWFWEIHILQLWSLAFLIWYRKKFLVWYSILCSSLLFFTPLLHKLHLECYYYLRRETMTIIWNYFFLDIFTRIQCHKIAERKEKLLRTKGPFCSANSFGRIVSPSDLSGKSHTFFFFFFHFKLAWITCVSCFWLLWSPPQTFSLRRERQYMHSSWGTLFIFNFTLKFL